MARRPLPAAPPQIRPARPATRTQPQLCVPGRSGHLGHASAITNQALLQTRHIAAELAATRGWNERIIAETGRALAVVLAGYLPGDKVAWSHLPAALRSRKLSVTRTAEILSLAGLLHDDRVLPVTALIQARLALLPPLIAADAGHWLRTRSQGGPRNRPRSENTVRMNLNRVQPLLLEWAGRYAHLREVTAADITAAIGALSGSARWQTFSTLRSLFGHCKKTGKIFHDPTRGLRIGQRPLTLIQPLRPEDTTRAIAAAGTPAARLVLALAAVHAARPKTIRELHLADTDIGNRRLTLAGQARPLDELTRHLLLAWLEHRGRLWPGTANPHLIINQQTTMTTAAVSSNWLGQTCHGLLERLRVDRQLEEALTHGPDPLHLAAMFGLGTSTAVRYAAIARQLQQTPAEQHHPPAPPNPEIRTPHRP
jgi:hypothetical protein